MGTVGKHPECSSFLTAAVRKNKRMGFEKFSKSYFGENYEEAKENYETGFTHERLSFQRKYPGADMKNFVFDAENREREKNFHEVPEQERGTL